jgi:hypothetical protein
MSKDYLYVTKQIIVKIPLNRKLTIKEITLVQKESIHELPDDAVDWNAEILVKEDYLLERIFHDDRDVTDCVKD